jgi:hypothetical protein
MAVTVNITVFWNVCRVVWYMFTRISNESAAYVIRIEGPSSVLKTDRAERSSEMSVNIYQTTRH